MKCAKIRELLRDYLRQETDPHTTAAVTGHLGICDDCARELAFLRAYYAKVSALPIIEAPNNLLVNIKRNLKQTGNPEMRFWWNSRFWVGKIPQISGALTVILVVLLVANPFRIGQKLRQDAKHSSEAPQSMLQSAPQTEQKDESKEIMTFGANEPQAKTAKGPVMENRSGAKAPVTENRTSVVGAAVNSAVKDGGRQTTGERRLILTMRQPMPPANKAFTDAGTARMEDQNGAGESDQNTVQQENGFKKEQRQAVIDSGVVLEVKTLIKSVAGEIVQEEVEKENGQPSWRIRIPVQNYTLFLEKLQEIGSVKVMGLDSSPTPGVSVSLKQTGSVAPQFIDARLILK